MPSKVLIWYRKDRKKWYGVYRLRGRRIAKAFDTRKDAKLWQSYMSHKLNHEGWKGIVGLPWHTLCSFYHQHKEAQGITETTRVEIINSLSQFIEAVGSVRSDKINQSHIEQFVRFRKSPVTRTRKKSDGTTEEYLWTASNRTINKDLEALRALYRWCVKNNFMHDGIEFNMLKTTSKAFKPPTHEKLADLFTRAKECPPLYLRMILAVATGLRRSAIERIGLNEQDDYHISIEASELVTREKKTGQEMIKSLGPKVMAAVMEYHSSLPPHTRMLFDQPWDGKVRFTWERIRRQAGLPKLTFHQLRNLSVSMLADKGESPAVLQKHTGHRSFKTTEGYIGVSSETRDRVTDTLDRIVGTLIQSP